MLDPSVAELVVFRRVFNLNDDPSSATLKISADNIYLVFINDYAVGAWNPGGFVATDGNWHDSETYDIKDALNQGDNRISIIAVDVGDYEGVSLEMEVDYWF